jgi:hypothetical protein
MIPVWAETGDFRDNNHHGLSTDHTSQLNFGSSRSRNRDRKGELCTWCFNKLQLAIEPIN